jgi:hypothetical protein
VASAPILVIFDAGYDPMRLAYQLADLPVEVLGRLHSDRCCTFPPRRAGPAPMVGRPATAGGSPSLTRLPGRTRP